MRVIAGRLGGRRLRAPRGRVTRPTSDRVKEAVFALLGDVQGASVLDLFAGAGGLGIEAISRGARRATFVERDTAAVRALRENLGSLGLDAEVAEVRRGDVLAALRTARAGRETYDLVLIDPPYSAGGSDWEQELSAQLPALLEPQARVVVESDRRRPLRLHMQLERERVYGDTSIRIHRHDEPSREIGSGVPGLV
jgi:16S rRNA (guanine966-N2)-methyltransferase